MGLARSSSNAVLICSSGVVRTVRLTRCAQALRFRSACTDRRFGLWA